MWNKESEEGTDLHREKRYEFIREQVRPQRKNLLLLWIKRFLLFIAASCIFGGVAGGIMVLLQNQFVKPERDIVEVNAHSPEPEQSSGPEEDREQKRKNRKEWTLMDTNRFSRQLSAVGTRMDSAMVGVRKKQSAKNWLKKGKTAQQAAYGIIYHESTRYFSILTTYSIIKGQSAVGVQLRDNIEIEGQVMGSNAHLNIAVVRIRKADITESILPQITIAQFGDGLGLSNGTSIVAVGSPNGILHSVITGIITNDSVCASIPDGEVQLCCTSIPYSDAANGVALDTEGNVVGVITTKFKEETGTAGIALIKIPHVTALLWHMQRDVRVPGIGIEGKSLSVAAAEAYHLEVGAYVTEVYSESPAYEAGLRVADVITEMDGETVSGMQDIYSMLLCRNSGDTVVCTVSRESSKGKVSKKINVKLK